MATLASIILTHDTIWENEFDGWSPVSQTTEVSEGGTIFEEHTSGLPDGRPITIISYNAKLALLRSLEDLRDANRSNVLTLVLPDGRNIGCIFDHNNNPVMAEPVKVISDYAKIADLQFFTITLHLMQVM